MADESCKNVNPSQNPNPNLKCKKTFLENIQNPCQKSSRRWKLPAGNCTPHENPISKQKSTQKSTMTLNVVITSRHVLVPLSYGTQNCRSATSRSPLPRAQSPHSGSTPG